MGRGGGGGGGVVGAGGCVGERKNKKGEEGGGGGEQRLAVGALALCNRQKVQTGDMPKERLMSRKGYLRQILQGRGRGHKMIKSFLNSKRAKTEEATGITWHGKRKRRNRDSK